MQSLLIRAVVVGDLPAVIRLLADDELGQSREIVPTADQPVDQRYLRAFGAMACDPNQLLLVGMLDEKIVACLQLTIIPGLSRLGALRAQIESVRVAAAIRGQGIGRKLLGHAIDEARRRGCALVQLTTDKSRPDAQRFYESLGFVATHEGMKLKI